MKGDGDEPTPEGYMATDVNLGHTAHEATYDHGADTGDQMGHTWGGANGDEMGMGVGVAGHTENIEVMTALGPMPLPAEVRAQIPGKFVAKPIIEEREIYVAKKEIHERTIEMPHVQYDHRFKEATRKLNVTTLNPRIEEIVREVPREVYKPVIEEKVIHVPQGVKYVEVPVEVPVQYPPRIVARPQVQIIERVVETIKPVIKEEIIEVPQKIIRNVPKVKTVEIPYYVPRYVEKIVEVPYKPNDPYELPPQFARELPNQTQGFISQPSMNGHGSSSSLQLGEPIAANMMQQPGGPMHNMMHGLAGRQNGPPPQMGVNNGHIGSLPDGYTYGPPNDQMAGMVNAAINPNGFGQCMPQNPLLCGNQPQQQNNKQGAPMMITSPPEVGNVTCVGSNHKPVILTRHGLLPYQGFSQSGNSQMLFPPLAPDQRVPLNPSDGAPIPPPNMPPPADGPIPPPPSNSACNPTCTVQPAAPRRAGDIVYLP